MLTSSVEARSTSPTSIEARRRPLGALAVTAIALLFLWLAKISYEGKVASGVYGEDATYDPLVPIGVAVFLAAIYLPVIAKLLLPPQLHFDHVGLRRTQYGVRRKLLAWTEVTELREERTNDDRSIVLTSGSQRVTIEGGVFGWTDAQLRGIWIELTARAAHAKPDVKIIPFTTTEEEA